MMLLFCSLGDISGAGMSVDSLLENIRGTQAGQYLDMKLFLPIVAFPAAQVPFRGTVPGLVLRLVAAGRTRGLQGRGAQVHAAQCSCVLWRVGVHIPSRVGFSRDGAAND